jgi:serine/threonine-protein kinase
MSGPPGPTEFSERFLRDAGMLARLRHNHLLQVYDFGLHEGRCWLLTQLAPELSLAVVHRRTLRLPETLAILSAAGSAIDYLHTNGIYHGHLTPHDVRVGDTAVFLDVGAEWIASSPSGPVGNPHYLCPERIKADVVGASCDVYALGMIAYEALTGRAPFGHDGPLFEVTRKLSANFALGSTHDVIEPALAVLRRCLAVDVSQRWPSATSFVAALEQALA